MFCRQILLFMICLSTVIYAGETRLEWNKLIFGNGGGFEDKNPDALLAEERIQVLNLSNLPGDYFSKSINVTGPYHAREPFAKDVQYTVSDLILMTQNPTTLGLNDNHNVVVGDLGRAIFMIKGDTLDHMVATPTGNRYQFRRGKFKIQPSGEGTVMGMKNGVPAVNIFNNDGAIRVGIGTSLPGTVLTVAGNVKVTNGTIAGEIGVFRFAEGAEITRATSSHGGDYRTIASKEFSVEYVNHTVLFFGSASLSANYDWAYLRLSLQERNGAGVWVNSALNSTVESATRVSFDSSNDQDHFSMATSWSGVLPPGSPTKQYRVLLKMSGANVNNQGVGTGSYGGANGVAAEMGTDLLVLGLPNSNLAGVVSGPSLSPQVSLDTSFAPTVLETGNFFTTNKVLFANGGRISDSATGLALAEGSRFKRFKASKLKAVEHHDEDVLEVIKDQANLDLFRIGNPAGSYIGFQPKFTSFSWVTQNVHSTATTFNIPSAVNISNSALVVSGNVGVGSEPASSGYVLTVGGDLGFSGAYEGQYGILRQTSLSTDVSVGTTAGTLMTSSFDISARTTNYDVMILVNASVRAPRDLEMWVEIGPYISKKYRYSGDTVANSDFSFAFAFPVGTVTPQNYTATVRWRLLNGGGGNATCNAQTDSARYSASIAILAVPST